MRVRLLDELWITKAPDGTLELGVPTVVRREGGSAPGLVAPAPVRFMPGVDLEIHVLPATRQFENIPAFLQYPDCAGCRTLAAIELGTYQAPPGKTAYIEHNHGRG